MSQLEEFIIKQHQLGGRSTCGVELQIVMELIGQVSWQQQLKYLITALKHGSNLLLKDLLTLVYTVWLVHPLEINCLHMVDLMEGHGVEY